MGGPFCGYFGKDYYSKKLKHQLLNQQYHDVNSLDVDLLDAVSKAEMRHPNFDIAKVGELAAIFAGKAHYFHAGRAGRFGGIEHVGRVAAGADGEQHVAAAAQGLHKAAEHELEAVIVGHASHVRGLGEGDGGQRGAVLAVAAAKLLGKMLGIAEATAIAASQDFATILEAGGYQLGGFGYAIEVAAIGQKMVENSASFGELGLHEAGQEGGSDGVGHEIRLVSGRGSRRVGGARRVLGSSGSRGSGGVRNAWAVHGGGGAAASRLVRVVEPGF